MIDIHTHILPGIDDGSDCMESSLEMAELAVESGVSVIVTTPHCNMEGAFENYNSPQLTKLYDRLNGVLKEEGINLQLLRGMEIYGTEDVVAKMEEGLLIPLNDSRYYLMEFNFGEDPGWIGDILEDVLNSKRIPVIAHPERYYCIQDNPMILYEWMSLGCLSQLNRGSVFGSFGRHAKKTADILLEHELVTCIASDAHSPYQRTTYMADIYEYVADEYGRKYANRLLVENPDRIIKNQSFSTEGLQRPRNNRWF